ncbi:NAD(P)H-binding protein [Lactobacillus equicursoris]|uniref:NAD(P)H-binding protein n=1 Tax=Lactobacillus equicursoris TaxID=420645 RepID=UPI00242D7E3D|nr:NAD(P)H-binding protein [Lactobacillus equicursoris]MDD6385868.1 NAD(P)H-binding protein [Lactobacillus equicursoris]
MRKFVILHPTGRIGRMVIDKVLADDQFKDVNLTLVTDRPELIQDLASDRVEIIPGKASDLAVIMEATKDCDLVFLAKVDDKKYTRITRNLVKASKENGFDRIVELSLAGLYYEIVGEFGTWVDEWVGSGRFLPAREAGHRLEEAGVNYTLIRMPALTDWPDVKYSLTQRDQEFVGVSVSRVSVADLVLKIMADPDYLAYASVGIAQPETAGYERPVY